MNPKPEKDPRSASPSPSPAKGDGQHILIVEDNAGDVLLFHRAIKAANLTAEIHVVRDGEQAVLFFDKLDGEPSSVCPSLVILDINLPKKHGYDVLRHIRASLRCRETPVIVVSTSDSNRDRQTMEALGANRYFNKPSDLAEFMMIGDIVHDLLAPPQAV